MEAGPKRHHFIPQSYLAAWADSSGQVAIRRRGMDKVMTPHVRNVALENALYGQGSDARRIEDLFSQFEREWPRLRSLLITSGTLNREDRSLAALFIALQICRTPDHMKFAEFAAKVTEFAGTDMPTRQQVSTYLRKHHLGFEADEREVEAAWSLVVGLNNMFKGQPQTNRLESIAMSFQAAVVEVSPRISEFSWQVQACRKRTLVTTDRPITYWTRPTTNDQIQGVGLLGAEEVRLPMTPNHLLVLKKTGPRLWNEEVQPRRFEAVNCEAERRCSKMVIAAAHRTNYLRSIGLSDHGPQLRFNIGPGYRKLPNGETEPMGDVLHMFTPRY